MSVYGYVRVSSKDQNIARQIISLSRMKIPSKNIYIDKASGKDFCRPQYQVMRKKLNKGDTIFVQSIDRLGRDYSEILKEWVYLTEIAEVDIVVLDMPLLDTRDDRDLTGSLISNIVLQILSYVSEKERIEIKTRQSEGINAAKARGVKFGRPCKPVPDNFTCVVKEWKEKKCTLADAAKKCGMPKSTFYSKAKSINVYNYRQ